MSKDPNSGHPRASIYLADEIQGVLSGFVPSAQAVPYGSDVEDVYFDGYPQIIKSEIAEPKYEVKVEKDVMVPMRDGVRVAIDIYHPNVEDEKFPVILCWGEWGKDSQDCVDWLAETPQLYWDSPFWDGSMEACNYNYTVPRGYIHIVAEPRGIGNSEGINLGDPTLHSRKDIYDAVEWIARQPWCNGKVVMMGPSSYSRAQLQAGQEPSPHLVALRPDEAPEPFAGEDFTGIWDAILYKVHTGAHANDHLTPVSYNQPENIAQPRALSMPKEEFKKLQQELLNDPDVKYNMKYYSEVRYPASSSVIDDLIYFKHPVPLDDGLQNIRVPMYVGTCWNNRLYEWGSFEAYRRSNLTDDQKKMIVYPPMFPARPYVWYHDEGIRWFDYWVKGKDNGIMDEPNIKLFVMGVNKWKFENEWPPDDAKWTKFFLHPQGGLSAEPVQGDCEPETFTQPAPYLDPSVYCLRYTTDPFSEDTEVIGNLALHLDAAIDIDDTNWMVDVVDIDPQGNARFITSGQLKAKFRALDEQKSEPYRPVHLRQEPVPIVPGEKCRYDIALLPTANVFLKGHTMQVIIRNQDDMRSAMVRNGIYLLPFMQTVTHSIYFGESHLLVPITN